MSQVQFKFLGPLLTLKDKLFKIFPRISPQSLLDLWTQQFVQILFPLLLIFSYLIFLILVISKPLSPWPNQMITSVDSNFM